MNDITFRIHWLAFTIHASSEEAIYLYDNLFKEIFGPLVPLGNGGRGFKEILTGLSGFKVYMHPINENAGYFHIEIPGEACDALQWEYYFALIIYLQANFQDKFFFKRIDLAFDQAPFTPHNVEEAIKKEKVRSLAKRESLEVYDSPFKLNDKGELGCYTVNFGSRSSDRMIRVYNQRGFTRLELQTKDDRAHAIGMQLFNKQNTDNWFPVMVSHLRDFIDFDTLWWEEFIQGQGRAYLTVSQPRVINYSKMKSWVEKSVAPCLSVIIDNNESKELDHMINRGRKRRNPKYEGLLQIPSKGGVPPHEGEVSLDGKSKLSI